MIIIFYVLTMLTLMGVAYADIMNDYELTMSYLMLFILSFFGLLVAVHFQNYKDEKRTYWNDNCGGRGTGCIRIKWNL